MAQITNLKLDDLSRKRLAVYAFPSPDLADLIQAKMDLIFDSNVLLGDTRSIIGGAALYPPHITLKGPFRLAGAHPSDRVESARRLITALRAATAIMRTLVIRTDKLENYPSDALSITFDHASVWKLRELQATIIQVVDEFRAPIIEPNYQDAAKNETALKHGEPRVGDEFIPHITVVGGQPGGLSSPEQIELVRQLLKDDWCMDWTFETDRIGLLCEARFNGCWEVCEYFPLRGIQL